jgi:hypothetical protein
MDFGSGIVESARIVHFRSLDEERRRTLLTLVDLAGENSPTACWDDERAVALLRKETSAQELREAGADERMIAFVFPEASFPETNDR